MPLIAGVDLGRRRGPFLSWVELLVLSGMVSALLVILFPGSDFENPVHLARPDDLSIAYLRMLLRAHPQDAEARLLLVQQQKALGRLEEAHETLSLLHPANEDMASRAEVVALSLDRARLGALPMDDPRRAQLLKETHQAAKRLIVRTSRPAEMADLAEFVLSVGDPDTAARAYRRLAVLDRPNALIWLEKAARWSEAAGYPGAAARIYAEAAALATAAEAKGESAMPKTPAPTAPTTAGAAPAAAPGAPAAGEAKGGSEAKGPPIIMKHGPRLARLAMRALNAANEGKSGLAVARPLVERHPDDLELLELAVRMAVAAGDLSTARKWGEQRVILAGSSDEALRHQADILMKGGDPEGALRVAKLLLERAPSDPEMHKQVAQLARWSGHPEEALAHYAWLAQRGSEEARVKALDLSRALADSEREIEMLELSLRKVRRAAPPPMGTPGSLQGGSNRGIPADPPAARPRQLPGGGVPARRRPASDDLFFEKRDSESSLRPEPRLPGQAAVLQRRRHRPAADGRQWNSGSRAAHVPTRLAAAQAGGPARGSCQTSTARPTIAGRGQPRRLRLAQTPAAVPPPRTASSQSPAAAVRSGPATAPTRTPTAPTRTPTAPGAPPARSLPLLPAEPSPAANMPAPRRSAEGPPADPPPVAPPTTPTRPASAADQQLIELVALADALEVRGQPEKAIKIIDSLRFNFAERPEYWSRLARLYENTNQLERALACHEQLTRLKAMTLDDSVRQAQLLWRLLRPEAALTRLVALRGQARETDRGYFALLGDLAWRLEEHQLSAEAYAVLWKTQKRSEIGERLIRSLDASGRRGDAVRVAAEAYERLGQATFLVIAADLALKSGNRDIARGLFEKVRGKEESFAQESNFWFQRAQLAAHENRPGDAERDFQRVIRIDPRAEDALTEWLALAVHVQDRGMAKRALDAWGPNAELNQEAWSLLSDAWSLVGDTPRAERFRILVRAARARERAASGRPLTPDEQLEEAIERRDLGAIEARLTAYGRSISLPMRVAALRELGRDWDAWRLLEAAGMTDDKSLIASEDAAALVADVRDLREQHLSGAWFWGSVDQLGALEVRNAGARLELRARALLFGLELGAAELWALPPNTRLLSRGRREQRVRASAKLRERIGSTSLRAGAEFLPDGYRPFAQLEQLINVGDGKFELQGLASFNEVPMHSPLLRVGGVRDGIDLDTHMRLGKRAELGLGGTWARFSTRSRNFLTTEMAVRSDLAYRLNVASAFIRPRIDVFYNNVPAVSNGIPPDLMPLLTQREDPQDLLSLEYANVGVGLSVGSTHGDVGEALGPHISLRYYLDGWAGQMWPARKPSYTVHLGLGLVFAQHQELALSAFYFSDLRSAAGERYAGASLNYTLRWFR
jgi:tetratricopeptide (TPR) repeat protein